MSEPHHVTPARRPLPHPQSVHTSTRSLPLRTTPLSSWLDYLGPGPGPGPGPELEPAPGGPLDRCHRRRPRKSFTMRRKFSLAWSLLSIALAVPASRLTSKPARAAMPCSAVPVSKAAPFLVRRKFDRTSARRRRYASTRVSTAACSTLDKVSASSPCLMPPGSHRSPQERPDRQRAL